MKKFYNRNFAYGAAALLIGAVSFTACSSEDELSNTNPTYDGESVKTQFAINIPAAAKTRMTGEYTQQDGNFLGMKDIKLIPFASMPALGTESNLGSVITLGNISDNLSATSNAKVYNDVAIPVGTGAVILYGQANKEAGTNFDKGAVTMYNPQIQIFAESETKRPFFECSFKTKRTKKGLAHNTNNKARNKSQNHSISGFVKHNSTGNIIAFK